MTKITVTKEDLNFKGHVSFDISVRKCEFCGGHGYVYKHEDVPVGSAMTIRTLSESLSCVHCDGTGVNIEVKRCGA